MGSCISVNLSPLLSYSRAVLNFPFPLPQYSIEVLPSQFNELHVMPCRRTVLRCITRRGCNHYACVNGQENKRTKKVSTCHRPPPAEQGSPVPTHSSTCSCATVRRCSSAHSASSDASGSAPEVDRSCAPTQHRHRRLSCSRACLVDIEHLDAASWPEERCDVRTADIPKRKQRVLSVNSESRLADQARPEHFQVPPTPMPAFLSGVRQERL